VTLTAHHGDGIAIYPRLPADAFTLIVSDGAYGIGGFPGDPKSAKALPDWYAPHLEAWDRLAAPSSSLYFWCTPEGCARMLPHVEAGGWRLGAQLRWDKGPALLTAYHAVPETFRIWRSVSEDCYVFTREDWDPAGCSERLRAEGCHPTDLDRVLGVSCVASRMYLGSDRQAYPPTDADLKVLRLAFPTVPDFEPPTVRYPFTLPQGVTDVWSAPPVVRPGRHGCAKRDEHIERIVKASSRPGDRVLEPFGGGAPVLRACRKLGRACDSIERDERWHRAALASLGDVAALPDPKALKGQGSLWGQR